MSNFDPVTFSAVQKLKREVGEVTLVHSDFEHDDTWIDTGTFFDSATYPDLANTCKTASDITSFTQMTLPQLTAPTTIQVLQPQPKITAVYAPSASGSAAVIDTINRVYLLDSNGLTYQSTITAAGSSLAKAIVFFGISYYVFYSDTIYNSVDLVTWTVVDQSLFLDKNGNPMPKVTWSPTQIQVVNGNLIIQGYFTTDFLTWNGQYLQLNGQVQVAYANGIYVSVRYADNGPYHSADLISWSNQIYAGSDCSNNPNSPFNTTTLYTNLKLCGFGSGAQARGLLQYNGTFLIIAYPYVSVQGVLQNQATLLYYISTDGIRWTSNAVVGYPLPLQSGTQTGTDVQVSWGVTSAGFVMQTYNWMFTSSTGINTQWTKSAILINNFQQVGIDTFIGTGDKYSTDSLSTANPIPYVPYYKDVFVPSQLPSAQDVVGNDSILMYLDKYQNKLYSSTDKGLTWNPSTVGITPIILGYLPSTPTNGVSTPLFIATSHLVSDGYYTSTDGQSWTHRAFPVAISNSATIGLTTSTVRGSWALDDSLRGTFSIITYVSSTYMYCHTIDGINWTTMLVSYDMLAVFKNKMVNFLYTLSGTGATVTQYYLDFVSYQSANPTLINKIGLLTVDSSLGSNYGLQSVATDGNIVVAVAGLKASSTSSPTTSNIFWSKDGVYWNQASISGAPATFSWNRVVWTGHYFLAITAATGSYVVGRSFDGINWVLVDLDPFFNFDVSDIPGSIRIFTSGLADIFVSVDGVSKLWKVNNGSPQPYTNLAPSSVPGTKFVVKAVI